MIKINYSKSIQLARSNIRKSRKQSTDISKQVRNEVLERDHKRCIVCGTKNYIHLHHKIERSLGGKGIKENLVCLCAKHHNALHNGNKLISEHVEEYLDKHYPNFSNDERKYNKFRKEE